MKVLHLISGADAGGAKTHVLSLLRELNKQDGAALACLGDGVLAREARGAGLPVQILPERFFSSLDPVRALVRGQDILHCHGSRANLTGALLRPSLSCPVISTIHSDHRLDYLGRPAAGLVYGTLNAWALRRMDALVCVSEAMKDLYAGRGFPAKKLYFIYNGPDFSAPKVTVDREAYFRALGCSVGPEDVVVGAAVRLEPVKDLPTLLRGFQKAAQSCAGLKLVIAGTGPEEKRLRSLVKELELDGRVFLPGWLEDMDSFYAAIDITVLSSLSETFPYAVTEGARYGRPAVASRVGGVAALVEDGVNGFLFDPGDQNALAAALLRLTDSALRRDMGQALCRKAGEFFSLRAMAARQRDIYRQILAGEVKG